MTLKLIPCYEGEAYDGELSPFHALSGDSDDTAIEAFIAKLYDYCCDRDVEIQDIESQIVALTACEILIISGELVAQKGMRLMFPGCCVGLETWRDWEGVKPGGFPPWLGHGEAYYVILKEDYVIFQMDNDGRKGKSMRGSYVEVETALEQVQLDLKSFLNITASWLRAQELPEVTVRAFLKKLDRQFQISRAVPDFN